MTQWESGETEPKQWGFELWSKNYWNATSYSYCIRRLHMVTWSIFNIKMLELYRIDNIKRSAISLKHAWILRERLITTAQKPNQYVSFLKKHCCSLSGSAWWETLLIPVARNYKRVLSCSLFRSNRAARDYRCESQITVLAVLSWVTVLYPQRYWRKKMP